MSQPVTLHNFRHRLTHARCACCLGKKDRETTPWKPGNPMPSCEACSKAGCAHKWRDTWTRGAECPARLKGKRLSGVQIRRAGT